MNNFDSRRQASLQIRGLGIRGHLNELGSRWQSASGKSRDPNFVTSLQKSERKPQHDPFHAAVVARRK
jgi:hypothetical protein